MQQPVRVRRWGLFGFDYKLNDREHRFHQVSFGISCRNTKLNNYNSSIKYRNIGKIK